VKGRKGEILKDPDILNLQVEDLCTERLASNANHNRCCTFSQCQGVNNYTGLSLEEVKHAWENVKVENCKIENVNVERTKEETKNKLAKPKAEYFQFDNCLVKKKIMKNCPEAKQDPPPTDYTVS
jgi:hypothetical protein